MKNFPLYVSGEIYFMTFKHKFVLFKNLYFKFLYKNVLGNSTL